MADRIVVLRNGAVEQAGEPLALYDRPANAFVAGFIGSPAMNFIPGRLQLDGTPHVQTDDGLRLPLANAPQASAGQRVLYGTRPEHFRIDTEHGLPADVIVVEPTGSETQISVQLGGSHPITTAFRDRLTVRPGERLCLSPIPGTAHLFDAASGQRLN